MIIILALTNYAYSKSIIINDTNLDKKTNMQ